MITNLLTWVSLRRVSDGENTASAYNECCGSAPSRSWWRSRKGRNVLRVLYPLFDDCQVAYVDTEGSFPSVRSGIYSPRG